MLSFEAAGVDGDGCVFGVGDGPSCWGVEVLGGDATTQPLMERRRGKSVLNGLIWIARATVSYGMQLRLGFKRKGGPSGFLTLAFEGERIAVRTTLRPRSQVLGAKKRETIPLP